MLKKKKIKLPLWLKYFSNKTSDVSYLIKLLKEKNKPIICLLNGKPIKIELNKEKILIENITDYEWEL